MRSVLFFHDTHILLQMRKVYKNSHFLDEGYLKKLILMLAQGA